MNAMTRPPRASGSPLEGLNILLVDDHEDTLVLVAMVLRRAGAHVRTALSAVDGLAELEARPADLVVSDYNMPNHDGLWFIERVRHLPPDRGGNVPAMLLTAYGSAPLEQRAIEAGFQTCLNKPIEPGALIARAEALLGPHVD